MSAVSLLCIAGKNQVAVDILERVSVMPGLKPFVLPVAGDTGEHGWQPSLQARATELGVEIVSLDWATRQPDLTFLSLEYDKLIKPDRFASHRLFNIHFSLLPKLRGCFTSIWPILLGETRHGVTLHWIDAGMDTGPIIDQRSFAIEGMTARQIYFKSMDEGRDLVFEWLERLVCGNPPAFMQDEAAASTYRRADLDFRLSAITADLTVDQALARIRAFTFPEYQLPTFAGYRIVAASQASIADALSRGPEFKSDSNMILALVDGDLELTFDHERKSST